MAVQAIDDLVQTVSNLSGVVDSAVALISGFADRQAQAIKDALANGATAAELAPLTNMNAEIKAKTDALAAAVAANP